MQKTRRDSSRKISAQNHGIPVVLDPASSAPGVTVAITLKIGDDRNSRNPSALKFVETHGGTNANENFPARRHDREWCRLPISSRIRSDRQPDFIPGGLDGAGNLRRGRSDGGRADHGKKTQFYNRRYRGQRRARPLSLSLLEIRAG